MSIKTFKDKKTESVYKGKTVKSWQSFIKQAEKKLQILDDATELTDLSRLKGNRFKKLQGDRKGQYSIRINNKWRVCFRWKNNEPCDVEIVDYHD